jgi:hypothetical protein
LRTVLLDPARNHIFPLNMPERSAVRC